MPGSVSFRSPVRYAIPHESVNGERAKERTPSPWQSWRPASQSPLRGKHRFSPNIRGRSRLAPGDRSLTWFQTT